MRKPKRKNDAPQFDWNQFLQWVLVMAIVASVLVMLDVAWLWWIPFVVLMKGFNHASCSREEATVPVETTKKKRDEIV